MRRIEKQTSQQRIELENAKKYQAEQNLLRQNYNQKGKDIEKAQLNSIKERVWKKHKQTLQRRKKQLKEVAPPNTWEVYTMNQASRTLRSSFFLSPINQKKKGEDKPEGMPKISQPKTPLSLHNPLADYSLRLAMSHTPKNPFRLNQKRVNSVVPE
jgi:hypothetical protein